MREAIEAVLILAGTALILIAAIGVLRMPDLFTRMQATTKAASLGVGLVLTAAAVHFGEADVVSRAMATVVFIFLTIPIAAHLLGRAAYFLGVPLWERSVHDELRGRYDLSHHTLQTPEVPGAPAPPAADQPRVPEDV
jgi:multicomponent Na+:H+ antiporter subunit G